LLGAANSNEFITLEKWMDDVVPNENELILQMDIEGFEWEVLSNVSDAYLERFRIIVLEFHRVPSLLNSYVFINHHTRLVERLTRTFQVVHLHSNNSSGLTEYMDVKIPNAFEVTFLRRDRITQEYGFSKIPHPLDSLNDRNKKDIEFGWW
jgi:hypothetical protein